MNMIQYTSVLKNKILNIAKDFITEDDLDYILSQEGYHHLEMKDNDLFLYTIKDNIMYIHILIQEKKNSSFKEDAINDIYKYNIKNIKYILKKRRESEMNPNRLLRMIL